MIRSKRVFLSIIVIALFLLMPLSVQSANIVNENSTTTGTISADLKVRKTGGSWQDSLSSVSIGTIVEFQITVSIPRDYHCLGVLVELPKTSNGQMFNFITGSLSPNILNTDVGLSYGNNNEVAWIWTEVESSFSETMSFRATVKESGTEDVELLVGGDYLDNGNLREDQGSDSLRFSSSKSKTKGFMLREKLLDIFPRLEKIIDKLYNLIYKSF